MPRARRDGHGLFGARSASGIEHQNIIDVLDAGRIDDHEPDRTETAVFAANDTLV
jgi:hypothetical protein